MKEYAPIPQRQGQVSSQRYNDCMIADALALIDFLQRNKDKYTTLSALFKSDGSRVEGSTKVELDIIPSSDNENIWYYRVKPVNDYVFVVMPVVSCYTDYGIPINTSNPDASFFRFVANPLATFQSGGTPNLMIDFSTIGYKPKQLLSKLEAK